MTKVLIDLLGWSGALLLLGAYGCVSFKRLRADSGAYQVVNGVGSLLLIVNTLYYHAFPSAFVNLVWICIAIAAGIRLRGQAEIGVRVDG